MPLKPESSNPGPRSLDVLEEKTPESARQLEPSLQYFFSVGVIGAGIGGCEVIRLLARNLIGGAKPTIVSIDENDDLFHGTSGAMARRMGKGGHYTDAESIRFYDLTYRLTQASFSADVDVFEGADKPGRLDRSRQTIVNPDGTETEVLTRDNQSVYVVAPQSLFKGPALEESHGRVLPVEESDRLFKKQVIDKVQVEQDAAEAGPEGKYFMFHGEQDGVLDLKYVETSYIKFFDRAPNITRLTGHWAHSFVQLTINETDKVDKIASEVKKFLANGLPGAEEQKSDYLAILGAQAVKLQDQIPKGTEKVVLVFGLANKDGRVVPFVRGFNHLHLAAYDGNTKLFQRSNFIYDETSFTYKMCVPVATKGSTPKGELRQPLNGDRYRSRRKFAVVLQQELHPGPITFIQGPFASKMREYLTAELVTNVPASYSPWGLFVQQAVSTIYKKNVLQAYEPALPLWITALQEQLLRKRTSVQEPLTKSEKLAHSALLSKSAAVEVQYGAVQSKYASLNEHITEEICLVYLSLLVQYYYSDLKEDGVLFIPYDVNDTISLSPSSEDLQDISSIGPYERELSVQQRNRWRIYSFIKWLKDDAIDANSWEKTTGLFLDLVKNVPNLDGLSRYLGDKRSQPFIQKFQMRYESIAQFLPGPSPHLITIAEVSGFNQRLIHLYESTIGIWIVQAAAVFMPILHFECLHTDAEGVAQPGRPPADFHIRQFSAFVNQVFQLGSDWQLMASVHTHVFNLKRMLTGEVLRVFEREDALEVDDLITAKSSSILKCRGEMPGSIGGTVTYGVTEKFWHGTHNALRSVELICDRLIKGNGTEEAPGVNLIRPGFGHSLGVPSAGTAVKDEVAESDLFFNIALRRVKKLIQGRCELSSVAWFQPRSREDFPESIKESSRSRRMLRSTSAPVLSNNGR